MYSFKPFRIVLIREHRLPLIIMTRTSEVVTNKGNSSDNNIKVI